MTSGPSISVATIGRERHMLVTVDDFIADPQALRIHAAAAPFAPARSHYPGIQAPLPQGYLPEALPILRRVFTGIFGRYAAPEVIDISLSMVTTPADGLTAKQSVPHCDAFSADRYALLHYLAPDDQGGTAFFRHRATGFEAVDEARAPTFFAAAEREEGNMRVGYVHDTTACYERTSLAEPRFNRALIYPSFVLHSGAIGADATLSSDPMLGRLTVTGFFRVAPR